MKFSLSIFDYTFTNYVVPRHIYNGGISRLGVAFFVTQQGSVLRWVSLRYNQPTVLAVSLPPITYHLTPKLCHRTKLT